MDVGGFDALEVTEAGLREGVFFAELLAGDDPPLFADVRARLRRATSPPSTTPTRRTPSTSRGWRWRSGTRWRRRACTRRRREERELLWAPAMLHDIGTAVDYDDHHKHSRYLILNAGLPGFSPRETALIGQIARYHRKGQPGWASSRRSRSGRRGRCWPAARPLLRIAEQLERPRDQTVRHALSSSTATRRAAARGERRRHGQPLGRAAPGRLFQRRSAASSPCRLTGRALGSAHGANCITWWMPLGRFVYCMSAAGAACSSPYHRPLPGAGSLGPGARPRPARRARSPPTAPGRTARVALAAVAHVESAATRSPASARRSLLMYWCQPPYMPPGGPGA